MGGRPSGGSRRRVAILVCLAALVLSALSASVEAQPAPTTDGQILIVTVNLREGYPNGNDLSARGDMKDFVRRLLERVPSAPDVLLLQEVNGPSSSYVARRLTRATGMRYTVALKPPADVMDEAKGGALVHTQNAVVINATQMKALNKGGWVRTSYDRSDAAPGQRLAIMRQGHVLLKEKATDQRVGVMSVRFANRQVLESDSVSFKYRAKWSRKVAAFMGKQYGKKTGGFLFIGGDFNAPRCTNGFSGKCRQAAFWKVLTDRYNYVEITFKIVGWLRVDFIFGKSSEIFDAGVDPDKRPAYSDHRFRWGVVGAR